LRTIQIPYFIPFVALALIAPYYLPPYYLYIAIISLYYSILASSWNLLAGYTGQISFAHAALSSIGAYTSALLVINLGIPTLGGIVMGGLSSFVVGYLLGKVCLRLRGPYLALTTISFSEIFRIIVTIEYEYTRGSLGLNVPPLFEARDFITYYFVFLGLFTVIMSIKYLMLRSRIGLFLRSIREDEEASNGMGVDTVKWKQFAFAVSGLFAGLAGSFLAHFILVVSPEMGRLGEMALIISMTVIGGMGTFWGPVIGAFIVEFASELLRDVGRLQLVVFGALILVIIRYFREGIWGYIDRIFRGRLHV